MDILLSSLIIIIAGCLLHFTYGWSKQNKFVALFSAVNESTWEHIKIALVPAFAITVFRILTVDEHYTSVTIVASAIALLSIIILIPLFFYPIKKILKKAILWVDIVEFCIVAFLSQINYSLAYALISEALTRKCEYCDTVFTPIVPIWLIIAASVVLILISGTILFFSFFPLKNFIFIDPRNQKYGLDAFEKGHNHAHTHHHGNHAYDDIKACKSEEKKPEKQKKSKKK